MNKTRRYRVYCLIKTPEGSTNPNTSISYAAMEASSRQRIVDDLERRADAIGGEIQTLKVEEVFGAPTGVPMSPLPCTYKAPPPAPQWSKGLRVVAAPAITIARIAHKEASDDKATA